MASWAGGSLDSTRMAPEPTPPVVLSVAGSDPSGGAGLQGDLKTFAALCVYGAAVPSALTVQDTVGVRALHAVPPDFFRAQLACVLADLPVAAAKTGMLGSADVVRHAARALAELPWLVVDPVLASTAGEPLLEDEAFACLVQELIPRASVLTPNLPEAARLLDLSPGALAVDMEGACRKLLALGPAAVLLKGGHAVGSYSEDLWWDGEEFARLGARRLDTRNSHGTGCALSAALAAHLARGESPLEAARSAKRYVTGALEGALEWKLGKGTGPLHHVHTLWPGERPG